jgi:isocitrate dehydrogenase
MKMTEGFMKKVFEEIAKEYPEIESQHIIIDNCAHQLVKKPEQFDVIITTNMNGDIISDLSSGLIGGLGFAPSANIGQGIAIFEAVHGSAPKYAGQDVANPTAMILSGVLLLRHLGELEAARTVENAVLATLEEGIAVTKDVAGKNPPVGTQAYADAVIANFGKQPSRFGARDYTALKMPTFSGGPVTVVPKERKTLGADIFVEADTTPAQLGDLLSSLAPQAGLKLKMISNRGTQVYPSRGAETDCVDQWRCRFLSTTGDVSVASIQTILSAIEAAGYRWMHIEKLQEFDGAAAYTKAQGED